ncbi:hypothetical protein F2Q69_00033999 [Brassica cretica]|uniref:Uncharacterized protein n=1 Tax=Brassica cretica TaxID=69181 RepID=A0A8S9SQX8_BRACR|nr:hypothetical protein F2Q69_00033999 [Brassica cretica]
MPGPASKPHESKEVTAGEQSEGPQTVPRTTPTVEQAKQGRQVLEPADETQVEYWQMEAEVYTAELRSHPARRAQKNQTRKKYPTISFDIVFLTQNERGKFLPLAAGRGARGDRRGSDKRGEGSDAQPLRRTLQERN